MKSKEVNTSVGKFVMRSPKAGERNRAFINAEGEGGKIKHSQVMVELLPKCIREHPFGIKTSLVSSLDNMECEDYDLLVKALGELINPKEEIEEIKN